MAQIAYPPELDIMAIFGGQEPASQEQGQAIGGGPVELAVCYMVTPPPWDIQELILDPWKTLGLTTKRYGRLVSYL